MRILTFNWHTPYLSLLARLDHQFDVAPPSLPNADMPAWHESMRPIPANVTLIGGEEVERRLTERDVYDLAICHNIKDVVRLQPYLLPKILVFHNKLTTEAALGASLDKVGAYKAQIAPSLNHVTPVFISKGKRYDWGLPGRIVMPGIDVADYGGYVGETVRAIRVGNNIKVRDLMTGFTLQQEILRGLPNIIVGENVELPESVGSKHWDDLKAIYRDNRLLLNTNRAPHEDGYNLATLEAMATGMPTVNLANPTCPLTDGVDGFVADDARGLRERVERLLDDIELAKEMGAKGQESVARHFPIERFLTSWDEAIRECIDRFPRRPGRIFAPAIVDDAPPYIKRHPEGANILFSYTSLPFSTGAYYHRAFERTHNLVTVGGSMDQHVRERWNLGDLQESARPLDIPCLDYTVDMEEALSALPVGFVPDLFVWVETGVGVAPENMHTLACPTAAILVDTHLHLDRHLIYAGKFDHLFVAQRAYIPEFHKRGFTNVHWLPLGCDPEIHGAPSIDKRHDVGFVGSLTDRRRVELLLRIAEKVEVSVKRLFLKEMTAHFAASRLVFNNAIKNDLNMRVFEGLCSGSTLFTDDADGLRDFFDDGRHLIVYEDADAPALARWWADPKRESERERIARAGRERVLKEHTYTHRMAQMMKTLGR